MLEMKIARIADRWGVEHEYRIEAHPHAQGAAIATTLLKIVGPTVAKTLFAALQDWGADVQETAQAVADLSDDVPAGGLADAAKAALQKAAAEERAREQLQQFLKAIDEKLDIEATLARVFEGVVTSGGLQKLAPALFEFTFRDGQALKMVGLDCYAGNYREELLALWEVVQHNGFLELLSFSAAVAGSPRKAS